LAQCGHTDQKKYQARRWTGTEKGLETSAESASTKLPQSRIEATPIYVRRKRLLPATDFMMKSVRVFAGACVNRVDTVRIDSD